MMHDPASVEHMASVLTSMAKAMREGRAKGVVTDVMVTAQDDEQVEFEVTLRFLGDGSTVAEVMQ